ncbi:Uncharacterised protein [Mycobacteroides abscessus subsp. abscessus]|nr:Uncharacterised protein [Mycobacteroides abscessus subsp. abscessus]
MERTCSCTKIWPAAFCMFTISAERAVDETIIC